MRETLLLAAWTVDTASMCIALLAWICGTVWLLNTAARTERGLWAVRKGRPSAMRKPARVAAASRKSAA